MAKPLKHIHILGIAGTMTAPLALALKKRGYFVTGSDQDKIYPPVSDQISAIPLNQPLSRDIDLCIAGTTYKTFSRCFQEYQTLKSWGTPIISSTQYLADHLIKPESVLVAGSYGKTTISALLAWIRPDSNYFFGGISVNSFPSLNFSDSDFSVVEADESINGMDTKAKFLYFPVKYLILTSAGWEHKDSYPTAAANFDAYQSLIKNIPPEGLLVYNPNDPDIPKLLPFCRSQKIPYQHFDFTTTLLGHHNRDNINAVLTLCRQLKINPKDAVSTFRGIKRRLEIFGQKNNITIIDDFAQSAVRVRTALEAVRFSYPDRPIIVYFEPHASFLQHHQSLADFHQITPLIRQFILGKISFSANKLDRVTYSDWQREIGPKISYFPDNHQLTQHLCRTLSPGDILIHFSSGGLEGLNNLKTVYNSI